METLDDRAPVADASAPDSRGFNTRTLWVVLLFTVALIADVCAWSAFPEIFPFYLSWIISMIPLCALVAVERRSVGPRALYVLLWGIGGVVLERALWIIILHNFPGLYRELSFVHFPLISFNWLHGIILPSFALVGFSVGAFAGLRWPDGLLLPGFRIRTFLWLRVLINVVLITLVINLLTSTIIYGLGHVLPDTTNVRGLDWAALEDEGTDEGPIVIDDSTLEAIRKNTPPIRVGSVGGFGVLVGTVGAVIAFSMFDLVIVPVLLILAAMFAGAASQARRVLFWGAAGMVVWQVASIVLFFVLQVQPTQLLFGALIHSISAAGGLELVGFALGAWVGIRWPDSLAPHWLPWVHERFTGVRSLAVLSTAWVCAIVLLWAASKVAILLIGDPLAPTWMNPS